MKTIQVYEFGELARDVQDKIRHRWERQYEPDPWWYESVAADMLEVMSLFGLTPQPDTLMWDVDHCEFEVVCDYRQREVSIEELEQKFGKGCIDRDIKGIPFLIWHWYTKGVLNDAIYDKPETEIIDADTPLMVGFNRRSVLGQCYLWLLEEELMYRYSYKYLDQEFDYWTDDRWFTERGVEI